MPSRSTKDLERLLRTGDVGEIGQYMSQLPADVNPIVVAKAAVRLFVGYDDHPTYFFVTSCGRLPIAVIREVLPRLPSHPHAVFLKEAFDGTPASWATANLALQKLQSSYNWGSKPMKTHLSAVARSPRLLAAAQAAAVTSTDERDLRILAVLAIDGSEASVDALIPHFARAADSGSAGLEDLQRLKTHAKRTPALEAMFSRLDALIARRAEKSPALAVVAALGLEPKRFRARGTLVSVEQDFRTPELRAEFTINSEVAEWMRVEISMRPWRAPGGRTSFNHEALEVDELKVGRCEILKLPSFLAKCATKQRKQWNWDLLELASSLRGSKREQLVRCLSAPS